MSRLYALTRRRVALTRRLAFGAAALALSLAGWGGPAKAADTPIDYAAIAKARIIKCLHPTVKGDDATVEITKPTVTEGEISTTRVKIFYSGLIKKNSAEIDIMVRRAGSIRQMKIKVLADTATEVGSCDLVKNWVDF